MRWRTAWISPTITLCLSLLLLTPATAQSDDAAIMADLKKGLKLPTTVDWSNPDPCKWDHVACVENRVTRIQIGNQGVSGTLPSSISALTNLEVFEIMGNSVGGDLPSFSGMSSLQTLNLHDNKFTSIPENFFTGMTSLQEVYLDKNPFVRWQLPSTLQDASSLKNFSANFVNLFGSIPDFLNPTVFPGMIHLHLSGNQLLGELPSTFAGFSLQSLWLNGQIPNGTRTLGGSISVLRNMTQLVQIWLNYNGFTGPIPDLSELTSLEHFNLRDNRLTGPVPECLAKLPSLQLVNLTNNKLQGPTPKFPPSVVVDLRPETNSFCLSAPGVACDSRVDTLISFLEPFDYPAEFAQDWQGDDPCASWMGVSCLSGNITTVNLQNKNLSGTISPTIAKLSSLQTLILSHNNITGTIPVELTTMPNLKTLDVSHNQLSGQVPEFTHTKVINTGNVNIGKDAPPTSSGDGGSSGDGTSSSSGDGTSSSSSSGDGKSSGSPSSTGSGSATKSKNVGMTAGIVIGTSVVALVAGLSVFCLLRRRKKKVHGGEQSPTGVVVHPNDSDHGGDALKITVSSGNGRAASEMSQASSAPSDIHMIEGNSNLVISIQVLRNVTNNFNDKNVLGRGGFGTVYKGELHDGTQIAVKRMDSGIIGDKGSAEFTSEISVLTKVRHRHLVGLLGYCLDGNEKLLVYEYMPQGALSRHLFHWKEMDIKPLEWKQRLTIALDVARGVEYLHTLAHQSFIHRDLKPSNILLGDDMRGKVSDFGLVRLAPSGGKTSIETRLAGTFGYLAPEYAVMGRITTKVDVFSFGVILMELITGRKALDESQPEESMHLVTWFRRLFIDKELFEKSIDPAIDMNEETKASILTVAELAGHCCAREPYQRPDMSHAVNVLSSLTDRWKPTDDDSEDIYGIDLDMTLPQALKKWQALEGFSNIDGTNTSTSSSTGLDSKDNTQTSIPTRPSGFAESFTSADGR